MWIAGSETLLGKNDLNLKIIAIIVCVVIVLIQSNRLVVEIGF